MNRSSPGSLLILYASDDHVQVFIHTEALEVRLGQQPDGERFSSGGLAQEIAARLAARHFK
jgi:cytochrome c-type biogenesis protein CcmE